MEQSSTPSVFISYASRDRERVDRICGALDNAGVNYWRDAKNIGGGDNYGPEIVRGIRNADVLLLMCSDAAMRSKNVKQEIQLAWKYNVPFLPLLLEMISFPEQVEYWLEGWQWVEVLDRPSAQWLPRVLEALRVQQATGDGTAASEAPHGAELVRPATADLSGLRALARFTDQIWPIPADQPAPLTRAGLRDLGAPQDNAQHGFRLGATVRLCLEIDRAGHLLLIDEGTSGTIYCLCPSIFAPSTAVEPGRLLLPDPDSRYASFTITGKPGREHLLAVVTDTDLGLDWWAPGSEVPARVLDQADVDLLIARLRDLDANQWTALSTYFDVLA